MKQWTTYIKRILSNGGIFVLVVLFTYRMIFSKVSMEQIRVVLSNIDKKYLLFGLLTGVFMVCAEALSIKRNLRLLGEKKGYFHCLTYAFAGNFFSGITPAATGGQPMQLYLMCKDRIPASKGTLALLMDLGAYQAVITSLAILGYTMYFSLIHRSLGGFIPVLWVGLVLNFFLMTLTFTAMFSKRFSRVLVAFAAKVVGVFQKDKGANFRNKALDGVKQYQAGAKILKDNKGTYLLNSLIMVLRIIAMHSAPYWIYKAFGLTQASYFKMLALQSTLYVSCAAIPSPGGTGVGESAFLLYFKEIFPAEIINSAMVLSRGIGFYTIISLCGFLLLLIWIVRTLKNRRHVKDVKRYQH